MTNAWNGSAAGQFRHAFNVSMVTTFALVGWRRACIASSLSHPEIEVRMTTTQRASISRARFRCAIRFTVQPEPELHATRLFSDVLTPLLRSAYRDQAKDARGPEARALHRLTYDPEWAIWLRAVGMGDFKPKRGSPSIRP